MPSGRTITFVTARNAQTSGVRNPATMRIGRAKRSAQRSPSFVTTVLGMISPTSSSTMVMTTVDQRAASGMPISITT